LPWILAGGGAVVAAVVVVLVITLTGGPNTSDPESVAQAAVDAFNDRDVSAITDIACAATKDELENALRAAGLAGDGLAIEATAELGEVKESGDTATAEVTVTYTEVPEAMKEIIEEGSTETGSMKLAKENDVWCVSTLG
jgi:hypothetical protein